MGAAGLTSSSAEMAARGDVGVTIDTHEGAGARRGHDAVRDPAQRVAGAHARRRASADARTRCDAILAKWDLTAAVIGEVIAEPVYRVTEGERVVAEFPGIRLVTDCPTYTPEARESRRHRRAARARRRARSPSAPEESDPAWTLERLLASPTIASKTLGLSAVRHDGSHEHRDRTGRRRGGGAHSRHRHARIALKTDCNGRYVYLDPRVGARIAVAEAARNVACTGGRPMAITNNLNFGNPTRPEVYFQLREAVARNGRGVRRARTRRSPAATSRCTTRIRRAPCIRRR